MNRKKASKVWNKLFRPPCFGDGVHCPVLFTEKMYRCKYYLKCEVETLKHFKESTTIG